MKKVWIPLLTGCVLTLFLIIWFPMKLFTVATSLFLLALFGFGGSLGVHTRTNFTMSHLPREEIKHFRSEEEEDQEEAKLYKSLFLVSLPPLLYSLILYIL